MKKWQTLRLRVERLEPDGSGCAFIEGRTVLIKGALPGDEAEVHVKSVKRISARADIESIVSSEIARIAPRCPHFSVCGGCLWQDVPYESQCRLKERIVRDTLSCVKGMGLCDVVEFKPSLDIYYYRNKMEFSFDEPPGTQTLVLGLHESSRFDRVFDVSACYLQSELSNRIVNFTRRFVFDHGVKAYGMKSHAGLLRFLVIREGKNTGEVMVNLVTSGDDFPDEKTFDSFLRSEIPEATTVLRSVNRGLGSVASGGVHRVLSGDGVIREHIGNFIFIISPDSFFQPNSRQTETLYGTIRDFCGLTGTERLLDLYCGTGTIGIYVADGALKVTGVEMSAEAVCDAARNAEINGIANITFVGGQAEKVVHEDMGKFDVVVCDPPRAGIHPKAMNVLVRMRIPRIIYVSCNIKALQKDLETFAMAGYSMKRIAAFDMAPHTPHIETVALLELG